MVFWPASHSRVGIAEPDQPRDAQALDGGFELTVAHCADVHVAHVLVADFAQIAAGARDHDRAHTLRAITRQRAAHSDRLVVRMGMDRQQRAHQNSFER